MLSVLPKELLRRGECLRLGLTSWLASSLGSKRIWKEPWLDDVVETGAVTSLSELDVFCLFSAPRHPGVSELNDAALLDPLSAPTRADSLPTVVFGYLNNRAFEHH